MHKKGFTLLEILVVIAVLALLIFFLVPNLLSVQDRGKEAAVKGVMRNVQLAVEAYNMENLIYPIGSDVPLKTFIENYLMPGGYMTEVPKNPFTGVAYTDGDSSGKVMYSYDDSTGKYSLKGYKRGGLLKIIELTNM
ncbi:MAG: prepilin-type N-terminal cleavage/methylation domain-containing protein [Candidatus Margulisbacteria bacterium]|nr:prepilin-type N-terminal cleavage/methylation domain-containing protein [Candidatus Margulisiibacteriota bacterium]MBU1022003.1 prepilin-type N-terminal cleavage/methylation domain-containing protein [Candidatus Margulisiibacteriota bacterium]MBU1729874.1 prepilin-type N-terminal cleavage/methylation domain-containing protein [Candidatus Margulisiibacteriota bacterium]MBU1955204.1 prepilin-type N-terminal cleavage/methylation domain-containing protein [Candidatus Margulisiibacteriota bacteriu